MGGCYSIDGVIPVVHPSAFVHPDAVLIGDVRVGPRCYVGPFGSLRGDMGTIRVEEGSNVQDSCTLHCFPGRELVLGADSHIGHGAVLHGCRVGTGALIGIGAVIMDEVVVGAGAFVGAHSFVSSRTEIPAAHLAQGTPARVVRELSEAELAWKANGTKVYQELAVRSLATLRPTTALTELDRDRPVLGIDGRRAVPLRQYREQAGN